MAATCRIDARPYKAVLFDLDGVIADTMALHYEAYRQAFERYGIAVTRQEVYEREGMPSPETVRSIARVRNAGMTDAQLKAAADEKREIYRELATGHVKAFPEVAETLQLLRERGVRLALVTGSNLASVSKVLETIGLQDAFDVIVTADDTPRGKPYPDPYRKGMEMLGLRPEDCVVVENAPLGVKAAKSAGAGYVIGVTTTLPAASLMEADDVMPSFADIEECLARRATDNGARNKPPDVQGE